MTFFDLLSPGAAVLNAGLTGTGNRSHRGVNVLVFLVYLFCLGDMPR
jgi:hypothetical protein